MMSQKWTKIVRNKKYEIRYNCDTGREETEGVNGNPDPTVLDYPSLIDIGIMGSCYKNNELDADIEALIKAALVKLEGLAGYQV